MPQPLAKLLADKKRAGTPLLCVAAGSGQIASAAVQAGADMLMGISAGIYRQIGVGSLASYLPFGNSNEQTEQLVRREILPRAGAVPVIAGLMPDELNVSISDRIEQLKAWGVQGIVNWPTISFVDGNFRNLLESEGLDIEAEIALLQQARKAGLVTAAFALSDSDAARFAASGIDLLILNMGLTHEADLPTKRDQLQQEIKKLHSMFKAVEATGENPVLLAFGGTVTKPQDYEQILRQISVHGFAGGSVFERLPVHESVESAVRDFRSIGLHHAEPAVDEETGFGEIIGQSPSMKSLFRRIQQVAPYDVNVCIQGETGTGKELVANQIHRISARSHQSFVTVNCGAIPDALLESELFGHEKGAFTGAHRRRQGKFEVAQKGSLFLDEIGDLTPHGQVALLRAIQEKEITRVGSEHPVSIDVRIITASHQRLESLVDQGKFRADLYYRLNQITLNVPPLRERREDIPLLVQFFLSRLEIQLNRKLKGVSPDFLRRLLDHSWPGNIRELQHVIGQAALLEPGPLLKGKEVAFHKGKTTLIEPGLLAAGADFDYRKKMIHQALSLSKGNKSRAAQMLGITRPTLYSWLKEASPDV